MASQKQCVVGKKTEQLFTCNGRAGGEVHSSGSVHSVQLFTQVQLNFQLSAPPFLLKRGRNVDLLDFILPRASIFSTQTSWIFCNGGT